jgi:hypothetical protein
MPGYDLLKNMPFELDKYMIKQQSLTQSINQKWILKEENNFNSRKFHLAKYLTFLPFISSLK